MVSRTGKISQTAGRVPGELVHVGKKRTEKLRISVIDYDQAQFQEKEVEAIEECFTFKETATVTWINIDRINCLVGSIFSAVGTYAY